MVIKIVTEIVDFLLIVLFVGVVWMSVMYHEALSLHVSEYFETPTWSIVGIQSVWSNWASLDSDWKEPLFHASSSIKNELGVTQNNENNKREKLLWDVDPQYLLTSEWLSIESHLSEKIKWYTFAFNDLPPGRRIMIDSIDVDAPIVDVPYASQDKLDQGDFDSELKEWVVKYPYTAEPGQEWNGLVFGHSSVSAREREENPFGYVFYKLPTLEHGDIFDVVRDGQLFSYQIDKKVIKRPEDVGDEIEKYDTPWSKHLTLMACYPLLSDAQRILVKGKLIKNEWTKNSLWSNIFAQR